MEMDLLNFSMLQAISQRIFGGNAELHAAGRALHPDGYSARAHQAGQGSAQTMGNAFDHCAAAPGFSVILWVRCWLQPPAWWAQTVVAMGMIALPVMLRYHYSKSLASGIIAASGTLGQVIPAVSY